MSVIFKRTPYSANLNSNEWILLKIVPYTLMSLIMKKTLKIDGPGPKCLIKKKQNFNNKI